MPSWKKVIVSGSDATLNSVAASSQITVGAVTASSENSLILGPPPAGGSGEGGQFVLQSGPGYTSGSHIDNWQNQLRILRGTNAATDAVIANFNLHTKQIQFPAYNSTSAFPGTATANLAVDSNGNVITVSTSGGTVFPYTGNAVITGSLTTTGIIYAQPNGGMYFQGGDDAALYDINISNHMGIYGVQDSTVASIKLGSSGGVISGKSGNIGIGTTNPTSASLQVNGNVFASSFTGSLFGTASWATNVVNNGVTSVGGTGTVNGISLSGTVTSTGNLTLGGTLSGIGNSQLTNSTITIAGTSTALGSSISQATILAGSTVLSGSNTISGVALGGTLAALTAGTYLTSAGTYTGATARTFAVDATSANTVSKVVARDASGNFAAGRITTSGLYGPGTFGGNNAIWQFDASSTGYGIVYTEGSPDTMRFDVSGQALTGTPDFLVGDNYAQINGSTVWHAGNDGASSGLDADLLDGQHGSYYYAASNPNGYTTNVGTVTNIATAGSVNGITLTGGPITGTGTITLGGTLSGIGNSQLTNSSITVGSTAISLGSSATTITGLSSVTSTTFVGALTGNASTATSATSATTAGSVTNAVTFNNGGSGDASGTTYNGSAARTISYNTVGAPSTVGANASGTWGISITGTAASSSAVKIADNTTTNATYYPTFVTGTSGTKELQVDSSTLTYNPSTNTLTVANLAGNASTATSATSATTAGSVTNAATFTNNGLGDLAGFTYNGSAARTISYNSIGAPSTTGTGASGTWNINITGSSDFSLNTNNVNITDDTAGAYICYPLFIKSNTSGYNQVRIDSTALSYRPDTNILTAGTFAGTATSASSILPTSGPAGTYSIPWMSQTTAGVATYLQGGTGLRFTTSTNTLIATNLFVSSSLQASGSITHTGSLNIRSRTHTAGGGIRLANTGSAFYWDLYLSGPTHANSLFFNYTGGANGGYLNSAANVTNIDFTGQHRSISNTISYSNIEDITGLIVISDGTYSNFFGNYLPQINEALPNVSLSTQPYDKRVFGVISDKEEQGERHYAVGAWISTFNVSGSEDPRLIINSLGEGGMWICNENGTLENGDYITTSNIPGYGMKQADDVLHNYTVAKITEDCLFTGSRTIEFEFSGSTYKKQFVGVTYHCG